jgi:hypothetical protein
MDRVARVVRDIEPHDSVERYTGLGVDVVRAARASSTPGTCRSRRPTAACRRCPHAASSWPPARGPSCRRCPGLDDVGYLTSDTLWGLRELPPRLVVLGGGPIGCELAQSFARLGSQVTQVEMAPRLMVREDEDVSASCAARAAGRRRAVLTGHKALRCERRGGDKFLVVEAGGPKSASPSTCCCAPWAAWRGCRASGWKNWASR